MKKDKKRIIVSVFTFGVLSIFLIFTLLQLIFFIPGVEELYRDLGVELPAMFSFSVSLSHVFTSFWYIIAPLLLIITGALSVLIGHFLGKLNNWVLIFIYCTAIAVILFICLSFLCSIIYMPIYNLAEVVA